MKDGYGAEEQAEISRQDLYEEYVNSYRDGCTKARLCCDARLLERAAQYLLKEPEPGETFTVFPFYQAVGERSEALNTDGRKHLCAFIKATEFLETLCANLFLHPWKKEFKTLKTFTGPFVYRLLPVLRSSTIQSILASIGYQPHTNTPQSEFRLCEDADPDRAIMVGFELLLARAQCYRLLERLDRDQLGPQEGLELLQTTVGPLKPEEPTDKKTTTEQKEEKRKKEEADQKEVALYSDTRLAINPQPRPHHCSEDQSIMEMQKNYPDLAFRGRPLVQDPHENNIRSSSKTVHTHSHTYKDSIKVAEFSKRDSIKSFKAVPTTNTQKNDGSKADEVLDDNSLGIGCKDRYSCGTAVPSNTTSCNFSNADENRVDTKSSNPFLLITLRAGSKAEQDLKPGKFQTTAGTQTTSSAQPESFSLSMEDERKDL
ncbi:uncharacterized protein LOC115055151 [Echeneis naucrates]|nr:uncharacterized protein LOC115055151 [Echeneis naucrates]XP_029376521.1 uncharacterized protein LOC115055151 [Echeneis naucrates]XP_029376522.1 uncharacterized protein LOC115055151 [Echeneis naucrates]